MEAHRLISAGSCARVVSWTLGAAMVRCAASLPSRGYEVVGCEPSAESVRSRTACERQDWYFTSSGVDDDPSDDWQRAALTWRSQPRSSSTSVRPRNLPRFAKQLLRSGGHLIISTPYHGYLKNLILALSNKWDAHLNPFWDGGHIKFWSRKTLSQLLNETGFSVIRFIGAGRLPFLWKSMIVVAQKRQGQTTIR